MVLGRLGALSAVWGTSALYLVPNAGAYPAKDGRGVVNFAPNPTPRRLLLPPAARPRPSGVALEAVRPARPRVMCIVPASDLPEKGPGVELKINILFRDARLWPLYPFIYLLCNRPD